MRILIDITHPSDVHFFKHIFGRFQRDGHEVLVIARKRGVTTELLRAHDVPCLFLTRKPHSVLGMGYELLVRDVGMLRCCRWFRPDVLLCKNSALSAGWVGRILGIPSITIEENELAWLQRLIGLHLADHILTGTGFRKQHGAREVKFRGVWIQAYLEPRYFTPDPGILREAGVEPEAPYTVMRRIDWDAGHDIGLEGVTEEDAIGVMERLSRFGPVYLTQESDLPPALKPYRCPVAAEDLHHLLAYASVYLGEGVTTAAEAAVLGTPSVLCNPYRPGYVHVMRDDFGLLVTEDSLLDGLRKAEEFLRTPRLRRQWRHRRDRLLEESDDIVQFVVDFVYRTVSRQGRGGGP